MASAYPTSLDTTATLPTDQTDDTDSKAGTPRTGLIGFLAQELNNHSDAIIKIETELGTLPKGIATSVRERISQGEAKALVHAASTANVTLPNPGGSTLTVDGVILANGNRVLLKDQTTPATNGIYAVSGIGTTVLLDRALDADTDTEIADAVVGVAGGTVNADTQWRQVTSLPITMSVTALRFTRVYPGNAIPPYDAWSVGADVVRVLAETCDRPLATSTLTLATAATHLCTGGIIIPAGKTVTNVNFHYTTAAATITIFYVSLIRQSPLTVLATSANATGAWAAAPATKTVALSSPYLPDIDMPVYVGIACASTTAAVVDALPARAAAGNYARSPILVGNTTTPTSTPITGTAGALTATLQIPHVWLS